MDLKLTDRLALVSGSTAGIGYAIAEVLSREGARVIVNGRTQKGVDDAIASIRRSTGRAPLGFAGDLAQADAAEALVRAHPGIEIWSTTSGSSSRRTSATYRTTTGAAFST
jgi:NAD(P)-dependent dehydrogenase (short-subunit alcohol dehydrogenase family)